jgi:hypothetical protein
MIIYLVLGSKSRVGWCSKAATTGIAFVSRPYSTPILSALTYHTDLFKWSQFYLLIQSNHPRISLSSHLRDRDLCHDEEITLRDPTNLPMNGGESGDVTLALSVACTFPPFSIRKGHCTEQGTSSARTSHEAMESLTIHYTSPDQQWVKGWMLVLPQHY